MVCIAIRDPHRPTQVNLYHREDPWHDEIEYWLVNGAEFGNQTIGFDWRVILKAALTRSKSLHVHLRRLIFKAYADSRIIDPQIKAMLASIALGEPMSLTGREKAKLGMFNLADLCKRYLGRVLVKDTWRLNYHLLDDRQAFWDAEAEAHNYPKRDVQDASDLVDALNERFGVAKGEHRNTRAAWALQLTESWGVRTDGGYVCALKRHLMREISGAKSFIRDQGGWIRKNDSQDRKAFHARIEAGYAAIGQPPERNDPTPIMLAKGETQGSINGERTTLQALIDRSPPDSLPDLQRWIDIGRMKTDLSTFVDPVESGAVLPVNARWNILVESERLSCRKPNLTNQPKHFFKLPDGSKVGIRPCFVPRPGWLYALTDWNTSELRDLAQVTYAWFGVSAMRDALIEEHHAKQAGRKAHDLHSLFACDILGVSADVGLQMVLDNDPAMMAQPFGARDVSKRCQFGFAGNMYPRTFALTAIKEKFDLTLGGKLGSDPVAVAKWLRDAWITRWAEMKLYFRRNEQLIEAGGGRWTTVESWSLDGDGIVRGNVKLNDLCNHWFQNLTARRLKESIWRVANEAYNVESSPLWGARPVILPHDEIISEVPAHRAAAAAERQAQIMIEVQGSICPDVPPACEPALAHRWYKGAKPVYQNGVLVPWKP